MRTGRTRRLATVLAVALLLALASACDGGQNDARKRLCKHGGRWKVANCDLPISGQSKYARFRMSPTPRAVGPMGPGMTPGWLIDVPWDDCDRGDDPDELPVHDPDDEG